MEEKYIKSFSRLPSITGKDVIDLERYVHLPRTKTYDTIQSFLEAARNTSEVNAIFIKAEWGEGKTSIYEGLLQKPEIIKQDVVIRVDTSILINVIKDEADEFADTHIPGTRFLAALLYSIKDVVESKVEKKHPLDKIKIPEKIKGTSTIKFIEEGLNGIFSELDPSSRLFVFLDEFEDVVDQPSDIESFIIMGLVDLINGHPEHLCKGPYAGRFHLLIAVTPTAYAAITSKVHANIGRLFGQRVREVELEKLTRKDAYNFILGCLKYCWDGELPELPFCDSGLFNAIYISTLGNPRAIVNLIKDLLGKARIPSPEGKIKLITPEDFIHYLSGTKVPVYGGNVNILSKEYLDSVCDKVYEESQKMGLDADKALQFLKLLIVNPTPISERFIKKELGIEKEHFTYYLNIIGKAFLDLFNIRRPFLRFKRVISGIEDVYSKARGSTSNLSKLISALEFYEYNGKSKFTPILFVPYKNLSEIRFDSEIMFRNYIDYFVSLVPEFANEDDIVIPIDRELFPLVKTSEEIYMMLAPSILNIFYPSPSIFFLDFIEDVNKRFEIGMEIMRDLTRFESYFYEGVQKLLMTGCRNLILKEEYEQHGVIGVNIINIIYKSITEEYRFRTYLLRKLRLSPERANEDLSRVIRKKMKHAHIPLLLIFTWNPILTEVRGIIESLIPKKIMHYMEFPLTTTQTHQIIARIFAEDKGYKIREERWIARATRIIEEIRFEEKLKEWIQKGVNEGYTIKPLTLEILRLNDIPHALRTFLLTEGDIRSRYDQIKSLEEKFRIYGKSFRINPLDIDSPQKLKSCGEKLRKIGFLEMNEKIETALTKIEKRILDILKEYNDVMHSDDIEKYFVISGTSSIEVYLKSLMERKLIIKFGKENKYRVTNIDKLEKTIEEYKRSLNDYNQHYYNFHLGYLASVKKRDVKSIIVKECIDVLNDLSSNLNSLRFSANEELKRKQYYLFELLMDHFKESIDILVQSFDKALNATKVNTVSVERSLSDLERSIAYHFPNLEKKIILEESKKIKEKKDIIRKIYEKEYDAEEIKEIGKKIAQNIRSINQGLFEEYKGCPVFDVKAIQLYETYQNLRRLKQKCEGEIKNINEQLMKLRDLRENIEKHRLFNLKDDKYKKTPITLILLNWIIKNNRPLSPNKDVGSYDKEEIIVSLEYLKGLITREIRQCNDIIRELDEFNRKIEKFYSKEHEFNEKILSIEKTIDKLILFYKGTDKEKEIKEHHERIKNLKEEYNRKRIDIFKRINKEKFIKSLFEKICESESAFLQQKITDITDIIEREEDIFADGAKALSETLKTIDRLLKVLKKGVEVAKTQKDESSINQIVKEIEVVKSKIPNTLNELLEYKNEIKGLFLKIQEDIHSIRERIRDAVKRSALLSKDELEVLENLCRYSEKEFELNRMIDNLQKITRMKMESLKEIIFNLSEKGMITVKVFIE